MVTLFSISKELHILEEGKIITGVSYGSLLGHINIMLKEERLKLTCKKYKV